MYTIRIHTVFTMKALAVTFPTVLAQQHKTQLQHIPSKSIHSNNVNTYCMYVANSLRTTQLLTTALGAYQGNRIQSNNTFLTVIPRKFFLLCIFVKKREALRRSSKTKEAKKLCEVLHIVLLLLSPGICWTCISGGCSFKWYSQKI